MTTYVYHGGGQYLVCFSSDETTGVSCINMGLCKYLVVVLAVALAAVFSGLLEWQGELPKLEDGWWGKGPKKLDESKWAVKVHHCNDSISKLVIEKL